MALSRFRSLLLAAFATSFLALSIACLILNYTVLALAAPTNLRKRFRRISGFRTKTILITGINTPYGLRVARAFYQLGHNVVGADRQNTILPLHARLSISLLKFRRLQPLATSELGREVVALIRTESVDLWIDCSATIAPATLAAARSFIEQSTSCVCFVPSDRVLTFFATPQKLLAFAQEHGLPVPDSRQVKSRDDIHKVLNQARGKKRYVLKEPSSPTPAGRPSLLPRRTLSQTYHEVSKVDVKNTQLVLEQSLEGLQKFKTFSIIAKGELQALTACEYTPSGSYKSVRFHVLQTAMMRYTASLARHMGPDMSCHLCIDFCVDQKATETGVEQRILPVSGQINANTAGLSFQGRDGSLDLVRAYLAALPSTTNGSIGSDTTLSDDVEDHVLKSSPHGKEVFSLGYDVFLLLQGIVGLITFKTSLSQFLNLTMSLARHPIFDCECVYDFNDPLPFWYLYQVYLPIRLFLGCFQTSEHRASLAADVKPMIL